MSIGAHRSDKFRHLVLRVSAGEAIPEGLLAALQDERVVSGWIRGSGVLADIELRAYHAGKGTLGSPRLVEGRFHALLLEGSIAASNGEATLSLRALLGRETDAGLEMMSGEIGSAQVVALELFVTAFDDLVLQHTRDEASGLWLLAQKSVTTPARPLAAPPASATAGWSAALDASNRAERGSRPRPQISPAHTATAIPARPPPPPKRPDVDAPVPEPGDAVDHFAFGDCDVLKSDGDRLHLRVHKGGRVREIALAMLRVSRLDDADDGRRRFKLERRI